MPSISTLGLSLVRERCDILRAIQRPSPDPPQVVCVKGDALSEVIGKVNRRMLDRAVQVGLQEKLQGLVDALHELGE